MISGKNVCSHTFGLLIAMGVLTNFIDFTTATAGVSHVKVSSSSPSGWTLDQLMSLIAKNKLDEVRYDETFFSDILSQPLKSSGTLRFIPPSKLEKHVIEPTDERYVIDGNDVLFEGGRNQHPQRLSLQDYPSLRGFVEAFPGQHERRYRCLETILFHSSGRRSTPMDADLASTRSIRPSSHQRNPPHRNGRSNRRTGLACGEW